MKEVRFTKILKKVNFEAVWGELVSKKGFWRQSFTKYLRLILSVFQEFFDSIKKLLFSQEDWALGYDSQTFRHFVNISSFPNILSLKSFRDS